jgi:hypothetical protein
MDTVSAAMAAWMGWVMAPDGMTEDELAVLRSVLVAGVLCAREEGWQAALREIEARELGPDWLRQWIRDEPNKARDLAARTVVWVARTRDAPAPVEDQRKWWAARCAAGVSVLEVARAVGMAPSWVHEVEQGEIKATRAQMVMLWGVL